MKAMSCKQLGGDLPDVTATGSGNLFHAKETRMIVVLLGFADNKSNVAEFTNGHNRWIKRGFDDNVFLLAGSLQPNRGGAIVAHNTSSSDLQMKSQ